MTRPIKYFVYAGAAAVGAIAAAIMVPGLVAETNGQSPNLLVSPAQAETLQVAQADIASPSSAPTFPGGATSVQESYSDWQVSCAISGEAKVCSMIQQQTNRETGQRVLAIELRKTEAGMGGALMLPFGILLESGVTLQIDGGAAGDNLRFRTCVPNGCLVPLDFGSEFVSALVRGGQLNIATVAEGGNDITFSVSLRGFSAASSRIAELVN